MHTLRERTATRPSAKNLSGAFASVMRVVMILSLLCGTVPAAFAQQPGKPTRQEQRIIGAVDNRVLVADTTKFPFSAVVKLIVTFPDGTKGEGSGALIGPDKVLTAEHVVFDESLGGHAESIQVLPGYSNNYTSCKRTYAKSFKHGSHQGCHAGAKCDFAVLTLADSLGCDTGWFGFKQFSDSDLNDVFIAGYPGDLRGGERMYFVRTNASHLHGNSSHNRLSYRDWTYSGMSGGPIFTSDYYIVGIHTDGSTEANYGIALCNQLAASIRDWKYQ